MDPDVIGGRSYRAGNKVALLSWLAVAALIVAIRSMEPVPPAAPAPAAAAPDIWTGPPIFEDVTAASGVDVTFRNGEEANHYVILESLGGGVGLIDYDGDGLLDLFCTTGGFFDGPGKKVIRGNPSKLYKNLGNFKFKDVTMQAGLDQPPFYSHGVAVCDYDKDGWPDLLVTGYGRLALYRNAPGPIAEITWLISSRRAEELAGARDGADCSAVDIAARRSSPEWIDAVFMPPADQHVAVAYRSMPK
jgi:hypothetical protein